MRLRLGISAAKMDYLFAELIGTGDQNILKPDQIDKEDIIFTNIEFF
jgi:hypothetical protein